MARGNCIVVSANPRGVFMEGVLSDPGGLGVLPGVAMQLKVDGTEISGRQEYEVYNQAADGNRMEVIILREDGLQGRDANTEYNDGERIFLYSPLPGEEMNVRVSAPGTGTADAIAKGTLLIPDDGTGNFVATTGTPEMEPFQVNEADVTDVTAGGTLVYVRATGH